MNNNAILITSNNDSSKHYIIDTIIALSPIVFMAIYFYGARAAVLTLLSVASCLFFELLFIFFKTKKIYLTNFSSAITGIIIAMCLPITISYLAIIFSAFIATIFGKMLFGGFGKNVFNPAAVGIAVLIMFMPLSVFTYVNPALSNDIGAFSVDVQAQDSILRMLKDHIVPNFTNLELFFGLTPTAMGTGSIILIFAAFLYLFIRGTTTAHATLSSVITFALLALLFRRADYSVLQSVKYELLSGSFLFVSVFMLNDSVTGCKTNKAKIASGILFALLCSFFRQFSYLEEGAIFALLIVNVFSASLDIKINDIFKKVVPKFGKQNV